jgi:hypothetical protein
MIRQSAKPSVTENWAPQRTAWIARVSTCRSAEGRFDQIPGLLRVYLPYFRSALPTIIVYLIGVVALYVLARSLGQIFGWYRLP